MEIPVSYKLVFDKRLYDGAQRLFIMALIKSKESHWNLTETGLATMLGRSDRQVRTYIKNLKDNNYLDTCKYLEKGRWIGWQWFLYPNGGKGNGEQPIHIMSKALKLPKRRRVCH